MSSSSQQTVDLHGLDQTVVLDQPQFCERSRFPDHRRLPRHRSRHRTLTDLAAQPGGPDRALPTSRDVTDRDQLNGLVTQVLNTQAAASVGQPLLRDEVGGHGPDPVDPADIACVILDAVSQPPTVDVNEILIRPVVQGAYR
ncbi:hypothetical protein ACFOWZ_37860 [Lentzea rhizosphaerae]|uniref:Short chain dehydrogenase n=1 Tax=Lentzea rhizosphaerae TaxID=2041025 RepID=A0ABV8C5H6_9PSEU